MAYQVLQGIKIKPKGNYNLGRFSKTMVDGAWPQSYAFGGWIYQSSCEIGFSSQPSEIKLSIVLEVIDRQQKYATFDIQDSDLKCDAGNGQDENLYDIDFNGVKFTDFILYEKEISIENNSKILLITFKDYSIILDKIYIGLIKKQGNLFLHSQTADIQFPVICPDCLLAGDSLKLMGDTKRDLAYGSYVGINGNVYDNFANIPKVVGIFKQWVELFNAHPLTSENDMSVYSTYFYGTPHKENSCFDLNGGYLILGTEDVPEERCGDVANVSYNFNHLLASLRYRGMKFEGAFPKAITDADYIYKQNYVGSLREILQQWCSDLGYDFYCSGKTFIGINLNKAINIDNIVNVSDPTTVYGSNFSLNKNTAIISYKTNSSLTNTFKQSVITTNNRPRNQKIHSKTPKRYIGILPLHPIDFNRHSNDLVVRFDCFGNPFTDIAWSNNFDINSKDRQKTLPELDGRTFEEIDTSIALTHYNPTLRDIFCQDRALFAGSEAERKANFAALGLIPLIELHDEAKSLAIEKLVPTAGDEISNICTDQTFYRVFIGYYYPKMKEDIISWEQTAGNMMYKYGIVEQALLQTYPYMSPNTLKDLSSSEGFYGENGISLLRISHEIQPNSTQYYDLRSAPFKDVVLYSGLMTPLNLSMNEMLVNTGIFPTGLFYSELTNEWGTTMEDFKRAMSLNLDDPCVQQFGQNADYANMMYNVPKKFQDWRLENFVPQTSANLEDFMFYADAALNNLSSETNYDRSVQTYYDLNYKLAQQCSKLNIFVLTDTRNHPNISVSFSPQGQNYCNYTMLRQYLDKQRDVKKRRTELKTPSICDMSLLQEMCKIALSGKFNTYSGDSRFGCVMDEDKVNYLEEGFTYSYLTSPNSRGLQLKIIKNPIRNNEIDNYIQAFSQADINGNFYYSDISNDELVYSPAELNYTIVYPISTNALGGYRGILSSDVELEFRSPEIIEVFGGPVNSTNNKTVGLKMINNVVDPDIQPQLDPYSSRFITYLTVITGDSQIITTVSGYHNFIKNLNNYELTTPMKTVELSLAGSPNDFGTFKTCLTPNSGLTKLSMSVNDIGISTNLSFSDRPKILPKQESILNKIIPRIKL